MPEHRSSQAADRDALPTLTLSQTGLAENGWAITKHLQQYMNADEQEVRRWGWWPQVQRVLNGQPIQYRPDMPSDLWAQLMASVITHATNRIWSRQKIVHPVHPDMMKHLTRMSAARMPGSLFARQPYTDPLVVFPEPPPIRTLHGKQGRLLAFYVIGTRLVDGRTVLCSTHDPQRGELMVNFMVETPLRSGNKNIEQTRVRIPVGQGMFTIDDAIDRTLENFVVHQRSLLGMEQTRSTLGEMVRVALSVLVYLCTKNADVRTPPPRTSKPKVKTGSRAKAKRTKAPPPDTPARMAPVGWIRGPAMEATRRYYETHRPPPTAGGGWRQYWHQRRAHTKIVWTGPGRKVADVVFVEPYEVSKDLLAPGERPVQIHTVGAADSAPRKTRRNRIKPSVDGDRHQR